MAAFLSDMRGACTIFVTELHSWKTWQELQVLQERSSRCNSVQQVDWTSLQYQKMLSLRPAELRDAAAKLIWLTQILYSTKTDRSSLCFQPTDLLVFCCKAVIYLWRSQIHFGNKLAYVFMLVKNESCWDDWCSRLQWWSLKVSINV